MSTVNSLPRRYGCLASINAWDNFAWVNFNFACWWVHATIDNPKMLSFRRHQSPDLSAHAAASTT